MDHDQNDDGRRPTICQVLFNLQLGGAEVLAARMARRLSDEYRWLFACLDEVGPLGSGLRAEGFPVHVIGRQPGLDWRCGRKLAALFRAERVDLVHAHQYGPFFHVALARLPAGGPPILFEEHGRSFPDPPRRGHFLPNRLLLGRRDRVVGVGRDVRRALIENEGFPARRVEVIYNGIDIDAFATAGADRAAVRHEIGVGPDDFVILLAARLDPVKDHETALRALERLARRRGDVRLLIAGEGPRDAAIEATVKELGLAVHVRLLGRRGDVPRLLGAADLALLTSRSEGIPLALIEAMAAGLPVLATRVGGVPEVVQEGVTGLLAQVGDDAELAEKALTLAEDPSLRARLGAAGRARARALFSEEGMCAAYVRLYEVMLGRRPMTAGSAEPSSPLAEARS